MHLEHTLALGADRDTAWRFVSDVDGLLALLPGVSSVEAVCPGAWRVCLRQKVGYIEADFDVHVTMVRQDAPGRIEFRTEGKGVRVPAFTVTRDVVVLRATGAATELTYTSDVQFSGRLAALGHAVMKMKARELIAEFQRKVVERFTQFMVTTRSEERGGPCEPLT